MESVNDVDGIHQPGNGKDRKGDGDKREHQQFISDREFKTRHAVTREEAKRLGGSGSRPQAHNRPSVFPKVLTETSQECYGTTQAEEAQQLPRGRWGE